MMDIQSDVWFIRFWPLTSEEMVDIGELKEVLSRHRMPFETWGIPGGKTITDLLAEINADESQLEESEGALRRYMECATVDVLYEHDVQKFRLVEEYQVVGGEKRIRKRNYSLYEKKRAGEEPLACARRALAEELQIHRMLPLIPLAVVRTANESTSFRGLTTAYTFYPFELSLPEEWYLPDGYTDTSEAPAEIVQFKWK